MRLLLAPQGFKLTPVTSPSALVDQVRAADWDAVLMDLNYQRGTTSGDEGLQLLTQIRDERPELPIVVMTAWGDIDLAVRAMRAGAKSFVEKPWDNRKLVQILEREIAAGKGARERSDLHGREQRDALLIQRALMPASLPLTPRFELAGAWQPAGTLGGDCYDVFTFGPDAIGVSIADVAGKGLPAALLMSSLQAAVKAFAHDAPSPQALCASVNRLLCGQMIAGRFVTMVYLRLDAGRGTLAYANAGHNPPLLARSNGEVEMLPSSGTVLGVFADADYQGAQLPARQRRPAGAIYRWHYRGSRWRRPGIWRGASQGGSAASPASWRRRVARRHDERNHGLCIVGFSGRRHSAGGRNPVSRDFTEGREG